MARAGIGRTILGTAVAITVVIGMRVLGPVFRWYGRRSTGDTGSAHGLRLFASRVPDESNRELIQARLANALDVLAAVSPVHLRWLRRRYEFLLLAELGGGAWCQHVPEAGLLRISPQIIWRLNREALAVELAGIAARGRVWPSSLEPRGTNARTVCAVEDAARIAVARLVPRVALASEWQAFLAGKADASPPQD